jgi:hypothetical protein
VLDVPDQLNVSIAEQEFDRAVSLMKKSMSLNKMPVCDAVAFGTVRRWVRNLQSLLELVSVSREEEYVAQ